MMKTLNLLAVSLAVTLCVALVTPQAHAKTCSGNASKISYKILNGGHMSGTGILTAPNGCKMFCVAGSNKNNKDRICKWQ